MGTMRDKSILDKQKQTNTAGAMCRCHKGVRVQIARIKPPRCEFLTHSAQQTCTHETNVRQATSRLEQENRSIESSLHAYAQTCTATIIGAHVRIRESGAGNDCTQLCKHSTIQHPRPKMLVNLDRSNPWWFLVWTSSLPR